MLTSEFNQEIGSLVRSLQQRVLLEPVLVRPMHTGGDADSLEHIDRAIVSLIALRVHLMRGEVDAS